MPVTRIIIDKSGRVTIEGIGYTGKSCLADLRKIIEALRAYGIEVNVEVQQLKPEAHVIEQEREVEEVKS